MKNLNKIMLGFAIAITLGAAMQIPLTNPEKMYAPENLIVNPGFEINSSGWHECAASGAAPTTDVTAALSDLVLARNSTNALEPGWDLKISKPASDEQGSCVFTEFFVPKGLEYESLNILFKSRSSGMTVGESSDMKVFIASKTTSVVDTPAFNYISEGTQQQYLWQARASGVYQLILWNTTTNASAWDWFVDKFRIYKNEGQFIPFVSDWQSYTPTFTGFGTVSAVNFRWRQDGPDILIEGRFVTGTVTATEARISLPTGLVSGITATKPVGTLYSTANPSNLASSFSVLSQVSTSYVTFGLSQPSYPNTLTPQNANTITSNTQTLAFFARVPIQGWTSGAKTIGQILSRVPVSFSAYKNGGSITANTKITDWVVQDDSVAAWDASNHQYVVKYPGKYEISFHTHTGATTGKAAIVVDGAQVAQGVGGGSTLGASYVFYRTPTDLNSGQVISFQFTANETASSNTTGTRIYIRRVEDPAAFLTINRSTTKYLASNITSNTTGVASWAMSNLIVGKRYQVIITPRVDYNANGSISVQARHNGSNVAEYFLQAANGTATNFSKIGAPFIASATSVSFNVTVTGTMSLYGNGASTQSFVTLKELNNETDGGF